MMTVLITALALAATGAGAQMPARDYPSCDLRAQHTLVGAPGGSSGDRGQAHVALRANILQADIGNARKARRLTQPQADMLWQRVERVRHGSDGFTRQQGFLSAGERASYDRALDAVATRLCRR
ncbi:hypothetical protein MC45_18200 (plasmid) [Sphingomonas taxi]|jgi:hypothetical protein|uniref:Uncharacterized protein n=2 Tax=Sphingomonas taxi TaxID=1549858 RepID=A0A097ELM4_9SPHN|nr:hypothetical protein MC45_18200 [Sphingomonas taxi]